ncbi:MAG TPA: hypothetical protein VKX46_03910 [Ktedonobacteraceae bacterium]|nr:hypothetical protein [Ktedonobacteraceae bacterium]
MKYLAHLISIVTNPLFVALPTFLIIAFATAPTATQALLWWGITVTSISFVPFLFVQRGVRRGVLSDYHVSRREQRFVPMMVALGSVALGFIALVLLRASVQLLATIVAVILAIVLSAIITVALAWKISLHLVGMTGAVTVCVLLFGPRLLVLTPLIVLVAWARWKVGAHTWLQALAGIVLAIAVTLAVYWVPGIR